MKIKIVGVIVCVLLVTMVPITSDWSSSSNPHTVLSDSFEDYEEMQMLPDPELDSSNYETYENDNHDAFEANSFPSEVELRWSHIEGDELDFRYPSDITNNLPDCEEYVYVSESFTWDYNVLPTIVTPRFSYSVNLAGDFDTVTYQQLFRVYAWIIDSSGEWTRVYSSYSGAPTPLTRVTIGVDYGIVSRAWGGAIEDSYGVQTDPTDTLRFAVGLGPTYEFDIDDNEYWNWMNGVVQLVVNSMSLTCVVNSNPDVESFLEPDYVQTWGSTFDDLTYDMAITEEGEIYTIGTTRSDNSSMTLTKFSDTGAALWTRSIQGSMSWMGLGIAITDSDIIAVGAATTGSETDTLIAKWDHQGVLQWNKTVDLGGIDYGHKVDIAYDGSIFVIGRYLGEFFTTAYFAKFTSDGRRVWSIDAGNPSGDQPWDIAVALDGYVYTATRIVIAKWDMNGTQVWNRNGVFRSVKVTQDGNLYTTNLIHPTNILQQWHSDGTEGWNITLTYNHTYSDETYFYPELIGVTPAGWAYVRLTSAHGIGKFILAVYDTEGVQLWNQTINPEYMGHPYYHYLGSTTEVHPSGFVVFAPPILSSSGDFDTCLQIYLSDRVPPLISSPLTIVIIIVAVVIMAAIPLDYVRRRRSFGKEEELPEWMTTQVYLRS